ncbi:MAG: hypothetical protein ABW205_11825 [Burkholderiales bacterium]
MSPGRACPLHYRYSPSLFREVPTEQAATVYAVGGLYGNPQALAAVLDLKREDERYGPPVTLVFNGDFNWFDVDAESFRNLNETVLAHSATLGNVEAELQGNNDVGCGCAYPDYVDDVTVERSNRIMDRLRLTAARFPDLLARLATLPKVRTFEVGGERVGILHGDPESLAGWHFASDALMPGTGSLVAGPATSETDVARWFSDADVRAFLSSHTCLPVMRDFSVNGRCCVVANNGAAGMPNFRGGRFGLLTRVSTVRAPPAVALYGVRVGALHVEALPVHYNHKLWVGQFLANWPKGSPAHASYHHRICSGTQIVPQQAVFLGNHSTTPLRT